jgi:hypothetical protein
MTDSGWTVAIEVVADVDDDRLFNLTELLSKFDAATGRRQDGTGYSVTFTVPDEAGTLPPQIADYAFNVVRDAALASHLFPEDVAVVRVDVTTNDELDRQLAEPVHLELVGVSEIAEILAVSRQRAHQLTKRDDFPEPIAKLAGGPVWARPYLDRFVEQWHTGKPDVTDELAEVDELLDDLTRIRNDLVHGRDTAGQGLFKALMLRQLARKRIAAGEDPAGFDPADLEELDAALAKVGVEGPLPVNLTGR